MKLFVLLFLTLIAVSCQKSTDRISKWEEPILLESEKQIKSITPLNLKSKKVKGISEKNLRNVYDLLVVDNFLVLSKPHATPYYFEVFSLDDYGHIRSFGKEGQGPGEFSGLIKANVVDENERLIGFMPIDFSSKYYEVSLDSIIKHEDYIIETSVNIDPYAIVRIQKLKSGGLVGTGLHIPQRLLVMDSEGKELNSAIPYPFEDEMTHVNQKAWGLAFQSDMVKNHRLNRIGIFCYDSPNLDIISFDSTSPELIQAVHLRKPNVVDRSEIGEKQGTFSVGIKSSNKRAFVDVAATDNYIYALYSGKSRDRSGTNDGFADVVLVFDWQGYLVLKLKLESPTKVLTVVEDSYLLVLEETLDDTQLLRYDLPEL